jgi:hypothetical protein
VLSAARRGNNREERGDPLGSGARRGLARGHSLRFLVNQDSFLRFAYSAAGFLAVRFVMGTANRETISQQAEDRDRRRKEDGVMVPVERAELVTRDMDVLAGLIPDLYVDRLERAHAAYRQRFGVTPSRTLRG